MQQFCDQLNEHFVAKVSLVCVCPSMLFFAVTNDVYVLLPTLYATPQDTELCDIVSLLHTVQFFMCTEMVYEAGWAY